MIETVHFVAGLGAEAGKDLTDDKLLAMRLAKHFHPNAQVFLHTSQTPGSCDNYPKDIVRRVTHWESDYAAWPSFDMSENDAGSSNWSKQGALQSDKLRLHVLLTCASSNALYLDTDAYCVKNLDYLSDIEGCAMARLNPFMIANGMIYAGKDRSFIRRWYDIMQSSTTPPKSYVDWSCRLPHELSAKSGGLTVLDSAKYHGVDGDTAVYGRLWHSTVLTDFDLNQIIVNSAIVHTMGCRDIVDSNSTYKRMLTQLEQLQWQ